jgi:hypothetical protein
MRGRRVRTTDPCYGAKAAPGDYWQEPDGWHAMTPNGLLAWLKNHHVEEHDDGTVSVVAGAWGGNSILCSNGTGHKVWHGWIRRGVWEEIPG